MANDKRRFLSAATPSYGGFELQLGDVDKPTGQVPTYGGVKHPEQAGAKHIQQLQQDLVTLRFLNRAPSGLFDIRTEWAVREFQTYASLPKAAQTTEAHVLVLEAEALIQPEARPEGSMHPGSSTPNNPPQQSPGSPGPIAPPGP